MTKRRQRPFRSGFTLLEILLVTVLLFFLGYAVYTSVRATTNTKEIVESRSEILQEYRSAFGIIERDLRATYYQTAEDYGWYPRKEVASNPKEGEEPPPPLDPENETLIPTKPTPITLFQGKENTLFFTTRTHQRLSANSPENEEHFVFYELKNKELHRSESKRAIRVEDRQNPEDYRSFVLLENVISLKFSFWNPKQQRWVPDWDSEKSEFLNKVPEAVKVEIRFTPEYSSDKGGNKSQELFLITAVRLAEASYRNITWSKQTVSSEGNPNEEVISP
ncbi:MAG: type II secretion system protein GspJ [Bdellovibrionota bacterium]